MGCSAGFASAPVAGKQLQEVAIQGSVSLALRIGQAVLQAQRDKADPVAAAAMAGHGKVMFTGTACFICERRLLSQVLEEGGISLGKI